MRPRYPADLSYPAELESGTHLGRARRLVAETAGGGHRARTPVPPGWGQRQNWEIGYDDRLRALLGTGPTYSHFGRYSGQAVAPEVLAHRLDRLVSDLLPDTGACGPSDEAVYDVDQVDGDLAGYLGALRRSRREGRNEKAVTAMTQAMQRIASLTGIVRKTFPLKCQALVAMTGLPDNRAAHLVGIVDGSDTYGGPPPAGTLAFADLSLEALVFRLVDRRQIGDGKAMRYGNLRSVALGGVAH